MADVLRQALKTTPSSVICANLPVDMVLLHLEVGNPVAEEAADPVVALEDHDIVTDPGKLLGHGQSCGAGTNHRDLLAGL